MGSARSGKTETRHKKSVRSEIAINNSQNTKLHQESKVVAGKSGLQGTCAGNVFIA